MAFWGGFFIIAGLFLMSAGLYASSDQFNPRLRIAGRIAAAFGIALTALGLFWHVT